MKKIVFVAIAFLLADVAQVCGQTSKSQSTLEAQLGFSNPNNLSGFALGVQYGYSVVSNIDLLAAVEMANGYASSPSGNGTDDASINAFIIGARYRLPQFGRFEAGVFLQGGAALNWNYKADVAAAPNGFTGAIWTLDFLVGGQVDCMYLLTEDVALGLYGNYRYIFSNDIPHWLGAGVKLRVNLK